MQRVGGYFGSLIIRVWAGVREVTILFITAEGDIMRFYAVKMQVARADGC